jgi:hypothetical protein
MNCSHMCENLINNRINVRITNFPQAWAFYFAHVNTEAWVADRRRLIKPLEIIIVVSVSIWPATIHQ